MIAGVHFLRGVGVEGLVWWFVGSFGSALGVGICCVRVLIIIFKGLVVR